MSLDKFIRLDGPDFCGRDALVREAAGPPNRLVSLVLDSVEVPAYGAAVTTDDGQVGTLTSPCQSPSVGGVIGMAVIQTGLARVGQQVEVEVAGGTAAAKIATLPVYDPDKTRPRA